MGKINTKTYLIDPENLEDEAVKDKKNSMKIQQPVIPSNLQSEHTKNQKKRLGHYESIRKTNLEDIILPQIKKDLNYIDNKYQEKEIYHKKKITHLRRPFTSKQEAMAFNKKRLIDIQYNQEDYISLDGAYVANQTATLFFFLK